MRNKWLGVIDIFLSIDFVKEGDGGNRRNIDLEK